MVDGAVASGPGLHRAAGGEEVDDVGQTAQAERLQSGARAGPVFVFVFGGGIRLEIRRRRRAGRADQHAGSDERAVLARALRGGLDDLALLARAHRGGEQRATSSGCPPRRCGNTASSPPTRGSSRAPSRRPTSAVRPSRRTTKGAVSRTDPSLPARATRAAGARCRRRRGARPPPGDHPRTPRR